LSTQSAVDERVQRRLGVSTAIFTVATALSRVAGLIREAVAAYYFGTSKYASAFTIASQIPNLMSNLFAQAALSAAFVPVFTDLLQQGKKREAFRLASTLFWIILVVLGVISAVGILASGLILPLFSGANFDGHVAGVLTQIMFPVVVLLGLTGMLVGILQSYDQFSVGAISPVLWNAVILVFMVGLHGSFGHDHSIYAYAVGWLVATFVQLLLIGSALRRIDFRLAPPSLDWHDPRVRRVFTLMVPVTVGLGIINLDALINSSFGALVPTDPAGAGPRAIQYAFLLYMLPQGIFSVAVTTVLFPTLSRQAARRDAEGMRHSIATGIRQINLLLIPSAVGLLLLAAPITRLIFQRGTFDTASTQLTAEALRWFAVSLPFSGINLLLTRTFFALQQPWIPTRLSVINILVDIFLSIVLYHPFGLAGLVIGTAAANVVMAALQWRRLSAGFSGRLEGAHTLMITARIVIAAVICGAIARFVWVELNGAFGTSLIAQIFAVGIAVALAGGFYGWAVTKMQVPEARQIQTLLSRRLAR
jgi:putative peptidoglycan lipid II flippase